MSDWERKMSDPWGFMNDQVMKNCDPIFRQKRREQAYFDPSIKLQAREEINADITKKIIYEEEVRLSSNDYLGICKKKQCN